MQGPKPAPTDRIPGLEALAEQVRRCTLCPLHAGRIQAVPGEGGGRQYRGILLVGEAPGRNEDETGQPFCGAAGKNLDLGLAAAGWARNEVFVTSIVKCRPPGNRDPSGYEKASCRPYLMGQLDLLRPRLIVALGRHGLHGLMGEPADDFANLAGTFLHSPAGVPVFVSLHPAAIIYRQKWKERYLEDWRRVGEWFRSGKPPGDLPRPPALPP